MNGNQNRTSLRVGQVFVEFTRKPITAWGGLAALVGAFVSRIGFREGVQEAIPIIETSPNAKGIYPKVLAHLLTVLTGGGTLRPPALVAAWRRGHREGVRRAVAAEGGDYVDAVLEQDRLAGCSGITGRVGAPFCKPVRTL